MKDAKELAAEIRDARMRFQVRHGHASCEGATKESTTYNIWRSMRQRCVNSNHNSFKYYGARGIKFCERWDKFENFLIDMGERPDKGYLDRIDNNKDYEASNCRWVTPTQQVRNRRITKHLSYKNENRPLAEWAEIYGINRKTLEARVAKGDSVEQALEKPVRKSRITRIESRDPEKTGD